MEAVDVDHDRVHRHIDVVTVIEPHVVQEVAQVEESRQRVAFRGVDDGALLGELDAARDARLDDLPVGVGLRDEVHGTEVEALHLGGLVGREHDDRDVGELLLLAHDLQDLDAAHPWHHEVEQDDGDLVDVLADLLEGLRAVRREELLVVRVLHHGRQDLQVDVLVLDDEDVAPGDRDRPHVGQLGRRLHHHLGVLAGDGPQALQELLLLVHQAVGALEHGVEARVLARHELREAARDDDLVGTDVLDGAVVQGQHELAPDDIVAAGEDDHELVAAGAEHRAVLEDVADHLERRLDVGVACLVAERVVDDLEAVHVADDHGEALGLARDDQGVELLLPLGERVLGLRARERVLVGGLLRGLCLRLRLLLPALHRHVVDEHREQGQDEQAGDDEGVGRVGGVDVVDLALDEGVLGKRLEGGVRLTVVVGLDVVDGVVRGLLVDAARPDHGHEDHEGQKRDPDDDRLAEAPGVVAFDDPAEVEEADDRPDHAEDVGLRLEQRLREQVREKQVDAEQGHDDEADETGRGLEAVVVLQGNLEGRGRYEAVEHRRAERRYVHDPADGGPADEGHRDRDREHQQHRVGGDLMVVQAGEPGGQDVVAGDGVEEAGERPQVADEAREHEAQKRSHQYRHAGVSHVVVGRIEGGQALDARVVAEVLDVVEPARAIGGIGGDGEDGDEDVDGHRGQHGGDEDAPEPVAAELELLDGVGDALEADEGPGRDEGDAHGLGQDALVGQEGGGEAHLAAEDGDGEADRDADAEDADHGENRVGGNPLRAHAQDRDGDHCRYGQHHLAEVDVVVEYGEQVGELEDVTYEEA